MQNDKLSQITHKMQLKNLAILLDQRIVYTVTYRCLLKMFPVWLDQKFEIICASHRPVDLIVSQSYFGNLPYLSHSFCSVSQGIRSFGQTIREYVGDAPEKHWTLSSRLSRGHWRHRNWHGLTTLLIYSMHAPISYRFRDFTRKTQISPIIYTVNASLSILNLGIL